MTKYRLDVLRSQHSCEESGLLHQQHLTMALDEGFARGIPMFDTKNPEGLGLETTRVVVLTLPQEMNHRTLDNPVRRPFYYLFDYFASCRRTTIVFPNVCFRFEDIHDCRSNFSEPYHISGITLLIVIIMFIREISMDLLLEF